jgi:hypothetical protein
MMPASPFLESSAVVAQDAVNVLVAGSNPASPANSGAISAAPDNAAVANSAPQASATAADLSLIAEIFIGADKLSEGRFRLDEERFMLDLEEPPLFLRRAG